MLSRISRFPVRRALALAALSLLACAFGAARVITSPSAPSCYRFDRAYFGWAGRRSIDHRVVSDTSSVISLETAASPFWRGEPWRPPDAMAVRPLLAPMDSLTTYRWTMMSYWRPLGADSMQIVWRNGLYGPVFRLAVRGDSLEGQVVFTTDVAGAEKPPGAARAVRIACGGKTRSGPEPSACCSPTSVPTP